jgi:TolB-like protein
MEGLSINETSFEQWLASERERFRLIVCGMYARVSEIAEQEGKLEEALNFGLRLLLLDPLRETVHRRLMRLYAVQGRHDAALAQYERCRRELSDQLGVKPQPETEELARGIRARRRAGAPKPRFSLASDGRPDQSNWPARSDYPSIAVLPFTNLSADPKQRYFSDGVTEDIITELSRFRSLSVIAHNTAFRYRDENVDIRGVAEELGVQFVVEGSIRTMGKQFRVTAQLVDATTGKHVWAERFDCEEQAIFAVQDEVVSTIVGTLAGRLQAAGAEHARRKPPTSLAAYECLLRGNALTFGDPEADAEARRLFKQAIALDPEYARAHALLALAEYRLWRLNPAVSHDALERAVSAAKKAASLDQNDSVCQSVNGWIHLLLRAFAC